MTILRISLHHKEMKSIFFSLILAIYGICAFNAPLAQAGVFNLPEFVEYKSWALGLEPLITMTNGSGVGANVKFTYGISPLSNLQLGMGSGSGSKQFRLGGAYTLDFIPDLDGQIGAGIAFQGYTYHMKTTGGSMTEITAIPYIHNNFTTSNDANFDPYISLPVGMAFNDGTYRTIMQIVFGVFFKTTEHVFYNMELGLNMKDTDTYIATGITYRN